MLLVSGYTAEDLERVLQMLPHPSDKEPHTLRIQVRAQPNVSVWIEGFDAGTLFAQELTVIKRRLFVEAPGKSRPPVEWWAWECQGIIWPLYPSDNFWYAREITEGPTSFPC